MDHRPVNDIVVDLMKEGYVPSWCTACYRKGEPGCFGMVLESPIAAVHLTPTCPTPPGSEQAAPASTS